jgi:hypothetical protein
MNDDQFILPLPRNTKLAEIENITIYIAGRMIAARKSYHSSTDIREKFDIFLCLLTYNSVLTLLNTSYITEDDAALRSAKEAVRKLPDYQTGSTNFPDEMNDQIVDLMVAAIQASNALSIRLLSHIADNENFIDIADKIISN